MCAQKHRLFNMFEFIYPPIKKRRPVFFYYFLPYISISHSPVKIKRASFILGPNDLSPMIDWSIDLDEGVSCASLCLPFNLCFSKALQSSINNSQALTTQNIILGHKMQKTVSGQVEQIDTTHEEALCAHNRFSADFHRRRDGFVLVFKHIF